MNPRVSVCVGVSPVFNTVSVISWWFLLGVGTTFMLIVLPTLRYHPDRFMLTHTVALPIQD